MMWFLALQMSLCYRKVNQWQLQEQISTNPTLLVLFHKDTQHNIILKSLERVTKDNKFEYPILVVQVSEDSGLQKKYPLKLISTFFVFNLEHPHEFPYNRHERALAKQLKAFSTLVLPIQNDQDYLLHYKDHGVIVVGHVSTPIHLSFMRALALDHHLVRFVSINQTVMEDLNIQDGQMVIHFRSGQQKMPFLMEKQNLGKAMKWINQRLIQSIFNISVQVQARRLLGSGQKVLILMTSSLDQELIQKLQVLSFQLPEVKVGFVRRYECSEWNYYQHLFKIDPHTQHLDKLVVYDSREGSAFQFPADFQKAGQFLAQVSRGEVSHSIRSEPLQSSQKVKNLYKWVAQNLRFLVTSAKDMLILHFDPQLHANFMIEYQKLADRLKEENKEVQVGFIDCLKNQCQTRRDLDEILVRIRGEQREVYKGSYEAGAIYDWLIQ